MCLYIFTVRHDAGEKSEKNMNHVCNLLRSRLWKCVELLKQTICPYHYLVLYESMCANLTSRSYYCIKFITDTAYMAHL